MSTTETKTRGEEIAESVLKIHRGAELDTKEAIKFIIAAAVTIAITEEREACARIAEHFEDDDIQPPYFHTPGAKVIAADIRNRGKPVGIEKACVNAIDRMIEETP